MRIHVIFCLPTSMYIFYKVNTSKRSDRRNKQLNAVVAPWGSCCLTILQPVATGAVTAALHRLHWCKELDKMIVNRLKMIETPPITTFIHQWSSPAFNFFILAQLLETLREDLEECQPRLPWLWFENLWCKKLWFLHCKSFQQIVLTPDTLLKQRNIKQKLWHYTAAPP